MAVHQHNDEIGVTACQTVVSHGKVFYFTNTGLTVSENPWGCEFNIWQGPQVVKHSASVALLLGVIHKGTDIMRLTVVTNPWADHHGYVICKYTQAVSHVQHRSPLCFLLFLLAHLNVLVCSLQLLKSWTGFTDILQV